MIEPKPSKEPFEWALLAEQGRYAEAVREIAQVVQDEFSSFPSPAERAFKDKLEMLAQALEALTDLSQRMELLQMLQDAISAYRGSTGAEERDQAHAALLVTLEELGRRVPVRPSDEPSREPLP